MWGWGRGAGLASLYLLAEIGEVKRSQSAIEAERARVPCARGELSTKNQKTLGIPTYIHTPGDPLATPRSPRSYLSLSPQVRIAQSDSAVYRPL